jgi:F-type H+-transporting ATPase subunit epsilon
MKLEILTPEKKVFDDEIGLVNLPTPAGYISVLPHHTSLVTVVSEGIITIKTEREEKKFFTEGGTLEVSGNKATMLLRGYRDQ